jgi:integrase
MMRTTAGHVSRYFNLPTDRILLRDLPNTISGFRDHIKQTHPKGSTARTYVNYLRLIIRLASTLPGSTRITEIPDDWAAIYAAARKQGCAGIVRYAIEHNIPLQAFGDAELNAWGQAMIDRGRSCTWAIQAKYLFRRVVRDAGVASRMPQLSHPKRNVYAIPISQFPEALRKEAEEMIVFKQAAIVMRAGRRTKIGRTTASNLWKTIRKLYGFAILQGKHPSTLDELIEESLVTAFINWYVGERGRQGSSLRGSLGSLNAAVGQYRKKELEWFSDLLRAIDKESRSAIRQRKAAKLVDYDAIAAIPDRIRADLRTNMSSRKLALMKRAELLMAFLAILPWRQRNLREAKLGARDEGANIFKEEIRIFDTCAKPPWVKEKLRENPHATFWQALFREDEHKMGPKLRNQIHLIIPRELVPLLEDYIQNHRPVLAKDPRVKNLFVSVHGEPLGIERMARVIGNTTQRYAGRRVTPHLYRDIFAFAFLQDNPEAYLQLSKVLWHSNPKTTLDAYAANFDESHGALATEEWLERRKRGVRKA